MVETDKKRSLILEGAIKRFSHFGINKTTMAEIAEDLSVSKPALYYYFPDKQSLIVAVAHKILTEYLENVERVFETNPETEDALDSFIDLRKVFFQKYFMLHMGEESSEAYLKDPAFSKLIKEAKEKEVSIIAESLKRGVREGKYKQIDAEKKAALLLEVLMGLRVCVRHDRSPFPDEDTFEEILNKQKDVANIFLNGLKDYSNAGKDIK